MTLAPGSRLGPYEVTAKLGEGGMGEVYRATDSKLRREVAIKVLPAAFTEDRERLARFEREAQLLAQLHHPNIASIFGLEESSGVRALVMELVEGPTLAERLADGPLPVDEALAIAQQIAEALEEAHEKGIVHRDLKPQNVKASLSGKVKVLDFGLAKAMDRLAGSSSAAGLANSPTLAHSPTLTAAHGTQLGMVLGTAAYMAPEQARGGAVDRRADVWAFGVVLYEMLAGRSLFAAETVTDTLAGVLKGEIDLAALPASTPTAIRRLLRRCLERNPKDRLHDIADARLELQEAMSGSGDPALVGTTAPPVRRVPPWRLPAVAALGLALGLAAGWAWRSAPPQPPLVRAAIPAPAGTELVPVGDMAGPVAVSPDGSQLAFTARDAAGVTRLYVQPLAAGKARVIPASEGARYPFWSPDGRSLGFFDAARLLVVDTAEGGTPLPLAPANGARGGSWGSQGVIVFAPSFDTPLFQVPAGGGPRTPASVLDAETREGTHRFPSFLPDGRHYLFEARGYNYWLRAQAGVFVGSIDDPSQRVRLLPHASNAVYAAGRLLFVRNGDLCAQSFDPDRLALSGPISIVARDVRFDRRYSLGVFSAAPGVLAVQHGAGQDENELAWFDRGGQRIELVHGAANHDGVNLSPDGSQAVVSFFDPATSRSHLEVFDLARKSSTRLTFDDADDYGALWSPDGTRVLFARVGEEGVGLWVKPADGSAAERRLRPPSRDELLYPLAWSPDGSEILLTSLPGGSLPTGYWILPASGEGALARYTGSRSNGDIGLFSPDGRWVVFDANEGQGERTYLARYPDTGGRWQIGEDSAYYSRWTRGGREIIYLTADSGHLTALPLDLAGSAPRVGGLQRLFQLPPVSLSGASFDVSADGERILAVVPAQGARPTPYTLILNWERLLAEAR